MQGQFDKNIYLIEKETDMVSLNNKNLSNTERLPSLAFTPTQHDQVELAVSFVH